MDVTQPQGSKPPSLWARCSPPDGHRPRHSLDTPSSHPLRLNLSVLSWLFHFGNQLIMQTVPTTHPVPYDSFSPQNSVVKMHLRPLSDSDREAGRIARQLKLAGWAELGLRQEFADEAWMRDHIKAAGLRSPSQCSSQSR